MGQHIKRQMAPSTWPIVRKGKERWVAAPYPAGHRKRYCMPIVIALRDALELAATQREVRRILQNNTVLVNNRRATDLRQAIGLFDVLTINELGKSYRVVLTPKHKLAFVEVKAAEMNILPLRVEGKTLVKGGKQQINFSNGRNLLVDTKFEIGSTVLFDTKEGKLREKLAMKTGAKVVIIGGSYVGQLAEFKGVETTGKLRKVKLAVLEVKSVGGEATEVRTKVEYVLVVGGKEPKFTAVVA